MQQSTGSKDKKNQLFVSLLPHHVWDKTAHNIHGVIYSKLISNITKIKIIFVSDMEKTQGKLLQINRKDVVAITVKIFHLYSRYMKSLTVFCLLEDLAL